MSLLFRVLRSVALAVWFGGLVFFIVGVAAVAFKTFDPHTAGAMVRGSLLALHRIGLYAGAVYLLFTLALLASQRDSHPARAVELALVVAMITLTAYSQLSVIPRMETDRLTLGGDVTKVPENVPARQHFERLHRLSVRLESAVLIEALVLIILAPIHGRDDEYRYS